VTHLFPDTLEDLPHLQAAFDLLKDRCPPMLIADLNLDIYATAPNQRMHQVADFLAANGIKDMLQHFHSTRKLQRQNTCANL